VPRLSVKSWNRQVDRYAIAVARATKGQQESFKMAEKLTSHYKDLEKTEVSGGKKDEELPKRVWVLGFQTGRNDVTASGVQQLREEITAVLTCADVERDEVVVKLDSPGGTVTGYGLAGAQLLRLRDAGLHVTVAIDQVAASGGYLMACTAQKIICSPFAVIGSIGVVQELPVVYERLQREGIEIETTTAGKFKRTLTPFKKPTDEDREKNKQDIEDVLGVFKDFVSSSRPSVDIEEVATGETWIGRNAQERGLVDDLKTSDTLLMEYVKEGCQVLVVSLRKPAMNRFAGALASVADAIRSAAGVGTPPTAVPMAQWPGNGMEYRGVDSATRYMSMYDPSSEPWM